MRPKTGFATHPGSRTATGARGRTGAGDTREHPPANARRRDGERGAVIVTVALFLVLMLGFLALGVEIGRWYLVRAELSKSVDAGALEGARNITNPYIDPKVVALDFCQANFPASYLATPGSGVGTVNFDIQTPGNNKVLVNGTTQATSIFAHVLDFDRVPVASSGAAQKKLVEIMMVLDRSGSMSGRPIADLKVASKSFIDFFAASQAQDRVGMVSFATSVKTERALGNNFVSPIKTAIDGMNATGATNTGDAFAQTVRPGGFSDQSGVPQDARVQQFLVFFSDGLPTAFRGQFKQRGAVFEAVACVTGNCVKGDGGSMYGNMGDPNVERWLNIDPTTTGDGIGSANCGRGVANSTHWLIFDQRAVPGHGANDNCITTAELHDYTCSLVRQIAIDNATALKNKGVAIYCIGLGPNVDQILMKQLASSPDKFFYAPTSDQLQAIFQQVAQQIQLRLVQ